MILSDGERNALVWFALYKSHLIAWWRRPDCREERMEVEPKGAAKKLFIITQKRGKNGLDQVVEEEG